jgi:hypothetical protein
MHCVVSRCPAIHGQGAHKCFLNIGLHVPTIPFTVTICAFCLARRGFPTPLRLDRRSPNLQCETLRSLLCLGRSLGDHSGVLRENLRQAVDLHLSSGWATDRLFPRTGENCFNRIFKTFCSNIGLERSADFINDFGAGFLIGLNTGHCSVTSSEMF